MQGGYAAFLYVLLNVRVILLLTLMKVFLYFEPICYTPPPKKPPTHPLNPSCPEGNSFILEWCEYERVLTHLSFSVQSNHRGHSFKHLLWHLDLAIKPKTDARYP